MLMAKKTIGRLSDRETINSHVPHVLMNGGKKMEKM